MYPLKINEKYDQTKLTLLGYRFTTTYLWTYILWDFRENVGSHCGVDIMPVTPWQEVFAVLSGTVIKSINEWVYGNHIIIEHKNVYDPNDLSITTTLYSCYMHLSLLNVNIWESVLEWQIIGKTGNTGNSFWEHLHFQIDRKEAPFHPYWPYTGAESKAAWLSFMDSTNQGLWFENGKKFTINPLVYLDTISNLNKNPEIISPNIEIKHSEEEKVTLLSTNNEIENIQKEVKKENFTDISENDPYYTFIWELVSKWVINGYEDNTFRPQNSISRTELLKMIFLFKWTSLSRSTNNYFTDILDSSWQKKYVNTAVELKLISTENKKFHPNGSITRSEALKMILLFFVWEINSNYNLNINDISTTDWYAKYFQYAWGKDLFEIKNNYYYPNKAITRYEVVGILSKM